MRGNGKGDRVPDPLVKPTVGSILKEERLLVVGPLVDVVSQFVMDSGKVFTGDVDAHLDPEVFDAVHVPGAGVAHDFPIGRFGEKGSLPEGLRQGIETEGSEKALTVADHLQLVDSFLAQNRGQVQPLAAALRSGQVIDVSPQLAPHVA